MNFLRQLDILDPNMVMYPITIIGVGGIGSPTALVLAKMGCKEIFLFDPDIVKEHNLPNQFYHLKDVGRLKVQAVSDIIGQFSPAQIMPVPERFDKLYAQQIANGIVVSGVDSMKTRADIWRYVRYNPRVPFYIDARTGGEVMQIFSVRPSRIDDIEFYERNLFPDKEAAHLPCTAQSIIYTVVVVAGIIASQIKKWIKQEEYYRKISFDLKTMTLLTEPCEAG